jgi:hypothetical protein
MHKQPQSRALLIVTMALLASGCGRSEQLVREETAKLVQELNASPAVEMKLQMRPAGQEIAGQVIAGRLSQQSVHELGTLIKEAQPNLSADKYAALGEIRYESADGRPGHVMVLYISASEAGLCFAGAINLRKLDLSRLQALIGPDSETPCP